MFSILGEDASFVLGILLPNSKEVFETNQSNLPALYCWKYEKLLCTLRRLIFDADKYKSNSLAFCALANFSWKIITFEF